MKISRMPPKYTCPICNKLFRRRKQKDDHILFNRCKGAKKVRGTNKTIAKNTIIEQIDVELTTMKENEYYGRPYNFNPIPTGNRHYRCANGVELQYESPG